MPDRTRKIQVYLGTVLISVMCPEAKTMPQVRISMMLVRMAVARLESILLKKMWT